MARPLRPNIADAVYHVMARGNERNAIYLDDVDRTRFLETLAGVARRYGWECLAYCLMGNHYHLVVRTPRPNLSRGMCLVNGGYASKFNARYARVGHVFQGRFRSVLLRSSAHLRIAIQYVLRNPVAAGLRAHPGDWPWSSYEATLADGENGLVAARATLAWFGEAQNAHEAFFRFIVGDDSDPTVDPFVDDVELPSVPSAPGTRPPLNELLTQQSGEAAIALAHGRYGYSLREIGAALGRSRATVGRMLVAHEAREMLASSTWPRAG
jgi:REP element-mobilizing transposase RayT